MNAYMNINVRVMSAQAQAQIKALQAQVRALQLQLAAGGAAATGPRAIGGPMMLTNLRRYGSQLQWTGRQIRYNFTLPLVLAAGMATKFALDNEKAMTRVEKVYGDQADALAYMQKHQEAWNGATSASEAVANTFEGELQALKKVFAALSSHYGVQQKEVLETAGAWAAAGSSGVALAKSVELSLQAAILGDMELGKATESLIAIQSQYSLSTEGMILTLAELNAIENQTGISMQGLIDGFSRAAGSAREYGIDVRNLGAMLAALVPATGTAATAGNALKTIMSRIMAPTKESAALMKEFGVNTKDAAWQSATGMDRLKIIASAMRDETASLGDDTEKMGDKASAAFDKMSDSQRAVVATTLGSRYQVNRFLVLMRELNNESGYYAKALNATSDNYKVLQQKTRELNTVLESSPKRLQILWYTIQNGMADAIGPLIPYLIWTVLQIQKMTTAFGNLDPAWQKFILIALLAVAAIGPLLAIFGSLLTLITFIIKPFALLGAAVMGVGGVFVKVLKPLRFLWVALSAIGPLITTVIARFLGLKIVGAIVGTMAGVVAKALLFVLRMTGLTAVKTVVVWAAGMAALVARTALGYAAMVALATISYGLLVAKYLAHNSIMLVIQGAWMASSVAMQALWAWTIIGVQTAWAATSAAIQAVWAGGWLVAQGAWAALSVAAHAIWSRLWIAAQKVWSTITLGLAVITWAAWGALQRAWATLSLGMAVVTWAAWGVAQRAWSSFTLGVALITWAAWGSAQLAWSAATIAIQAFTMNALKKIVVKSMAFLVGPWGLLAIAVVAIIVKFKDQIVQIWENITSYFGDSTNGMVEGILNAWYALPEGVSGALKAVVDIISSAAKQIYEWFSYINPFARHSPSLVENVQNGMAKVKSEFAGLGSIGTHIKGAYADIKAFGKAVAGLLNGASSFEFLEDLKKIKKFMPGAMDEFIALNNRLTQLNADLKVMEGRVARQQSVVDGWEAALDKANAQLDKQQGILDKLTAKQDKWADKLESAKERLSNFANAPIKGMRAMSDRIFENEMAQKRLRLEMMKLEDATGPLDDVKSKMDAINGAQELLSGKRSDLRAGGAGGDILKTYDDQIDALEKQRKAYDDAAEPLQRMQTELDNLARKGEELDLTQSLRFDPLTRQIDQAANAMKELPFDEIMAGVRGAQADITKYEEKLNDATKAVNAQQAVVDQMTRMRDKLQAGYDRESKKLDVLKSQYDKVADAISAVEQTMQDAVRAADTMAKKMEKLKEGYVPNAVQNYRDAAGGNFADVGGAGIPFRKNWESEVPELEDMFKQLNEDTAGMFDKLNPFEPIKKKWGQFKTWWSGVWGGLVAGTKDMFGGIFEGVSFGSISLPNMDTGRFAGALDQMKVVWAKTKDFIMTMVKWGGKIWRLFWPTIKEIAVNAWEGLKRVWDQVKPEIQGILKELGPLFTNFLAFVKPIIAFLVLRFSFIGKVIGSVVAKTIKPALELFGGLFKAVLRVIKGVIQVISGIMQIFTGDFEGAFKKIAAGVGNIFGGMWDAIVATIKGAAKVIIGAVWGVVKGVFDWFYWLWDELIGHSIIPDIVNGIFFWFDKLIALAKWVFDNVVMPVVNAFKWLFDKVVAGLNLWWEGVTTAFAMLKSLGTWFYENVLKPVWQAVKNVWTLIRKGFSLWWAGVKLAFNALKTLGSWFWNNVLKPVLEKVKDVWNLVKAALRLWWSGIVNIWNGLKGLGKWVWDHVLNPVREKFIDAFTKVKTVVGDAKDNIIGKFGDIKTKVGEVMDDIKAMPGKIVDLGQKFLSAGKSIVGKFVEGIKSAANFVGDIAGTIWDALKDMINNLLLDPLRNALNFTIDLPGPKNININIGDSIPRLYKGGIVPGSIGGRLIVAGDRGHDEAIIPLTGPNSPFSRLNNANNESGSLRSDIIGPSGTSTVINIYGNLEFPNISDGDDVDTLITNLQNLAS